MSYMSEHGRGPTLIESCPYLRDTSERIARILDVADRNSVIEGLPPLTAELKARLRRELKDAGLERPEGPRE